MDPIRLNNLIFAILAKLEEDVLGLSIKQIHQRLNLSGITLSDVNRAIESLVSENRLEEHLSSGKRVFHLLGRNPKQLNLFEHFVAKDEFERGAKPDLDLWVEDETVRAEASRTVLQDIADGYASEEFYALKVRDIATDIAGHDPIELLLEIARWVVDDLNHLASELVEASNTKPAAVRPITRELGFRCKKAERFLQGLWRLDGDQILTIPTIRRMRDGAQVEFDSDLARARFRQRVQGDKILQFIEIPANTHHAAVGTDASVGNVTVPHSRGSFIPPIPASLFMAGAAMRIKSADGHSLKGDYWDFDIDPREVERYGDIQAAEEGLLISPKLKGEVITDFEHLSIAAMELRQYQEELRVVNRQADWHPFGQVPELQQPPVINLLFRDGRIFPLVHRIEDFEGASAPDDVLYGAVVRKEIEMFHRVFHNTAGRGRSGMTYAGVVKAPEFSWLAMIVFWYLFKYKGETSLEAAFYRPLLNDQAVAHLLFWGLCEEIPESSSVDTRYVVTTFQAIRRFSDIAFISHPILLENTGNEVVVDENSEEDWIHYIEKHIQNADESHKAHRRGVPSLGSVEEYYSFIDLCRRSAVAMFYAAPARMYGATVRDGAHFLMPRWEICMDMSQRDVHIYLEERMCKVLSWISNEDGLVIDGTHAVGGFDEVSGSLPLFIPDVVRQAHQAVTDTRTDHVRVTGDRIHELIMAVRDRLKKG